MTPAEAASAIRSGEHLALGGIWNQNAPAALVREIIRQGTRDLTLSASPAAGFAADLMIACDVVSRAYLPNVTFEHLGLAPAFRRAVETSELELVECDEPTLVGGYLAAAAGLPYTPLSSLEGSAIAAASPWLTRNIRDGTVVLEAPALSPDVVLLHAQEADIYGNIRQLGAVFTDRVMAKAAHRAVVVSADRIVENEEIRRQPRATTIPSYLVTHVVELPFGAHPCASHARYVADETHLAEYLTAQKELRAGEPSPWQGYRERFVDVDHETYLAELGGATVLSAALGEGLQR